MMTTYLQNFPALRKESVTCICRLLGLLICLCIYYAFYVMKFDEGSVQGSHLSFYIAKSIALFLLVAGFYPYKLKAVTPALLQGYVIFNAACFISYILASIVYNGTGDELYYNQLVFLPFVLILYKSDIDNFLSSVMDIVTIILVLEIPISAILDVSGYPLWQNRAYVGGMGNPNSFGVCLLMCIAYLWSYERYGKWQKVFSTVFVFGAFLTQSLLIGCLLWILPAVLYLFQKNNKRFIFRELQVTATYLVCFFFDLVPHLTRKILAFLNLFGIISYNGVLGSIVGREQQLASARRAFNNYSLLASTFFPTHSNGGQIYTPADSQYLSLILSFGIIAAVIFAGLNFLFLKKALCTETRNRSFLFVSLLIFNIAFLTNRILDYFPIGFFYTFILVAIFKYPNPSNKEINIQSALQS